METKEVKHVDVWSAAKLCAAISLVLTLIAGIISGAISAFIYNLAAGVFGGLRIDLE